MSVYIREKIPELLTEVGRNTARAYLLIGDRFLCRQATEQLEKALLADGGTVHALDGEEEDPAKTISRLRSFSLLPGRQIYRINDTRLFYSKKVARSLWKRILTAKDAEKTETVRRHLRAMLAAGGLDSENPDSDPAGMSNHEWKKCFDFPHPGGDLSWITPLLKEGGGPAKPATTASAGDPAAQLQKTLESGIPVTNILILLAEEVDKRKRFYKYLKDQQVVVDLSVDKGAGSKAQKVQKSVLVDLINNTLKEMGKTMAPGILDQLIDRVGFHPIAVVMETDKLCLSIDNRDRIEQKDLDTMVGRTRQEALFELTGAIGRRQLGPALIICSHLLENGIHPLAVIATLRNYVRTLLLFRALQEQHEYGYQRGMQANVFQQQCLPRLKEQERWKQELKGHPYAVYMQFKTAALFSLEELRYWLGQVLQTEQRLKSSPLEPLTVVQHLLVTMLSPADHKKTIATKQAQQFH
jgi:DNA polymerase-3 subunit delta